MSYDRLEVENNNTEKTEQVPGKKAYPLERLLATARHLAQSLDLEYVLTQIGLGAKDLLNAYGCTLCLVKPGGEFLAPVISLHPDYAAKVLASELPVEGSLSGLAFRSKRGLIFNNAGVTGAGFHIPGTPKFNDEQVMVAPFIANDEALGVILLNRLGDPFTEEDLAFAETFAAFASTALKNAQTYQKLQKEIEERQRAEQALRESEQLFRAAFQTNPDAINIYRLRDGAFAQINEGFTQTTGLTWEDVAGKKSSEVKLWSDDRDRLRLREILEQDRYIRNIEADFYTRDGSIHTCLVSAAVTPLNGEDHIISVARDIDDRKRAERALQESKERYRALFEENHSVMLLVDPESLKIVDANPAACRFYGYSKQELGARLVTDLSLQPSEPPKRTIERLANETSHSFQLQQQLASGEIRHVEIHSSPIYHHGKKLHFAIIHDVTQKVQAEHAKETLINVSMALRSAQSQTEILTIISNQITQLLEAKGAAIILRESGAKGYRYKLATGSMEPLNGLYISPGEDHSWDSVFLGQSCLIDEGVEIPSGPLHGGQKMTGLLALIPLTAKTGTTGVLCINHLKPVAADDLRTLLAIGEIAANALQRETLYEQANRLAANMTAVNTIGRSLAETLALPEIFTNLSEAVHELIPDIATLFIARYDASRQCILPIICVQDGEVVETSDLPALPLSPPGQGTQSEVIHTRKPLIVNHLEKRLSNRTKVLVGSADRVTQSALYVPLMAKNEVLGVLQIQSYTDDRFTEEDAELLAILANSAAVNIQNAQLFEETQRRLERLDALHQIDKAITTSFDLDQILDVVINQTILRLGVDAADILLLDEKQNQLVHRAGTGFRCPQSRSLPLANIKEGAAWQALQERKQIYSPIRPKGLTNISKISADEEEEFVVAFSMPLIANDMVKGVLELYHRSPLDPNQEWFNFLETLARQAAIAIEYTNLFVRLEKSNAELTSAYDMTLEGWAKALELRDKETEDHSKRVTKLTERLARAMGIGEDELVHIRRGALLHDIGKVGIPDTILWKDGPLNDEEWKVMQMHPIFAYEILAPIPFLRPTLDIPYCHHERWDGRGYPRGLRGEEIPLAARIFAVADVFGALRDDRPYRAAWPLARVIRYLQEEAGKHFDPRVVEAFFSILPFLNEDRPSDST